MLSNFTAKYKKIPSGYMGQIMEWPEVITEGKTLEECRSMLEDALKEMILAYNQIDSNNEKVIPVKRHRIIDRISANEICKQAGLKPKF
jgi:predicted RNase H-like HicB family nuclease